jgi:hypothetical protein
MHTPRIFLLGEGAVTLTLYIIFVRFSKLGYTNHVKISQPTSTVRLQGKLKLKIKKVHIFVTFSNIPLHQSSVGG